MGNNYNMMAMYCQNNHNIQLPMKYAHSSYMKNKVTTFHIKEATKRCASNPFKTFLQT